MQSIILIGDENFNLETLASIGHSGSLNEYMIDLKRFVVEFAEGHVFYDSVNNLIDDYDEEELLKIPFREPSFISMLYTTNILMRNILAQDWYPQNLYVDNDHGCIVPLKEYINT